MTVPLWSELLHSRSKEDEEIFTRKGEGAKSPDVILYRYRYRDQSPKHASSRSLIDSSSKDFQERCRRGRYEEKPRIYCILCTQQAGVSKVYPSS